MNMDAPDEPPSRARFTIYFFLVRVRPSNRPDAPGPIEGSELDVPLDGAWRYRQQE
jgi:hypothetical protein